MTLNLRSYGVGVGFSDFYNARVIFVKVSQPYQILIGDKTHSGTLKGPLVRTGVSVTPIFPLQGRKEESRKEGRKKERKKEK